MHLESREQHNPQDETWTKAREEVDAIVDRLGKRVDPGIKEAVVALRVLGLSTDASCEGHIDGSLKAPYIDVGQLPEDFARRWKAAWKAARERGEENIAPALEAEARDISMKIRAEHSRLLDLLEEFYRNRDVSLRTRIVVQFFGNTARLISQAAELQDMYPVQIQSQNLIAYRQELLSFTEFLKMKFFSLS